MGRQTHHLHLIQFFCLFSDCLLFFPRWFWGILSDSVKRGITVGEITDFKTVKYAEFRDPDGNVWLLQEFPPEVRQPGQSFYKKEDK
jgi:hypothetical protein